MWDVACDFVLAKCGKDLGNFRSVLHVLDAMVFTHSLAGAVPLCTIDALIMCHSKNNYLRDVTQE